MARGVGKRLLAARQLVGLVDLDAASGVDLYLLRARLPLLPRRVSAPASVAPVEVPREPGPLLPLVQQRGAAQSPLLNRLLGLTRPRPAVRASRAPDPAGACSRRLAAGHNHTRSRTRRARTRTPRRRTMTSRSEPDRRRYSP